MLKRLCWGSEKRPTLAVLPFRNLAGNPDAAFFEFSLADGVITERAGVKSLVVRPSAYIAPYVGQSVEPRLVGEELAASLVLAGGFIRTPERMRVTAQLIDTATGQIQWSDRIDLLSRDLLDVQVEIAERMLAGLKLRLTAEEQEQIERPLTRSPEAYEFYLRARDALFRYLLRTQYRPAHDYESSLSGLSLEGVGYKRRRTAAGSLGGRLPYRVCAPFAPHYLLR